MIQALLFDLDGTLVNNDPIHFQAWREILTPYNLDIDEEFYKKRITGRLNPDIVKDLLPQLTPAQAQEFIEEKEARYRQAATTIQPLEGLNSILEWANARSLKLALVTNAPRLNTQFMLKVLGLETAFSVVVLGEDVAVAKPDPTPYQVALAQLEVPKAAAIAFEDSPSGIRSAVSAGIFTVGIASTQEPDNLYQFGAELVIPNFSAPELMALLASNLDTPN
ncbi:HAD family hydrolase [Aliterella atlantica]|uniref:Hydrolase n=1 Tax=Aliterella atlantica CENA595 TaxID=1618023 RepID=A0A0D8ZMZ1_9CYAN|nr:HAD family phosphatase [Aliterella atlantica]KJH69707.1 hydrolase [Aliterella atlantica CENA595]